MIKFDLLYRAVIDYDIGYDPMCEKNVDNFSFWVLSMNMIIPIIIPSLIHHIPYYYESGNVTKFSLENKEELFKKFEENKSKIINVVVVQEIGTLNILELIYKSDDIESYKIIIQEFIDSGLIYKLFFKKEYSFPLELPYNHDELCDCDKCECGYIDRDL